MAQNNILIFFKLILNLKNPLINLQKKGSISSTDNGYMLEFDLDEKINI